MGETTQISWCDATFNYVWGCARVSPGCEHCYAEQLATVRRKLPVWGVDAARKPMSEEYWRQPARWNRKAAEEGVRRRVFCSSMADVFEIVPERNVGARAVQDAARARLWPVIESTPWLDWLLLTKRPENVAKLAPWRALVAEGRYDNRPAWPDNVWIGTTAEDQKRADERIPWLIEIPARVRFVSVEPQLEAVDLANVHPYYLKRDARPNDPTIRIDALRGHVKGPDDMLDLKVDWVIVGGESGPGARPFAVEWARSILAQCRAAKVPCFIKQLGARSFDNGTDREDTFSPRLWLKDRKGADMAEWPPELRVREFPIVRAT